MNSFFKSAQYQPFLKRTSNLTEQHDSKVRDTRVFNAVNAKNITLMSNSFARGTDFLLLDEKINQKGGIHIIQAFLSLDQSEQIQIKGRTARQNNNGSYDCIIDEEYL